MSESKAQLYAGNPLSLTDADLNLIEVCARYAVLEKRRTTTGGGKGKPRARYEVFRPATRGASETIVAVNLHSEVAMLIILASRYLALLPVAVRELRAQAPEAEQAKWRASS